MHRGLLKMLSGVKLKGEKEGPKELKEDGVRKAAQALPEGGEKHPPRNGRTAEEKKGRRGVRSHMPHVRWR